MKGKKENGHVSFTERDGMKTGGKSSERAESSGRKKIVHARPRGFMIRDIVKA